MVLGVIDIDNQTGINHRYGSAAGDLVISSVRNIVLEFAVGRYAGTLGQDSFYVVFTSSNAESARFELQNLCQRVSTYDWSTIAKGLYVTCTGGVAEKHSDESTLSWAIRAAEGWRAAKMLGGNSVVRGPLFTKKNDTEFSLS